MPGFYLPGENDFDPQTDDFVSPFISRERQYKHFDLPLNGKNRELIIDFTQENKPHRFLPMLGYMDVTWRFTRQKDSDGNWLQDTNGNYIRKRKKKKRPIRFAGHSDSAYFEAYAKYLDPLYEQALKDDGTSGSVLAYRKNCGTNINHAKSLFDEIVSRRDCIVVAMDISGFFDSLDHILLRDETANLLSCTRLEGHHGTIWKNITRYAWVETADLDTVIGKERNGYGRICSHADFVKYVRGRKNGLVRTHDLSCGIPQGTPLSGLYANIYLRIFDREMLAFVNRHDGSYRRYSDDIAVVLPIGIKVNHIVATVEKILADFNLAMSVEKTEQAEFQGGKLVTPSAIQYLGFTFDGNTTLIRLSTLDRYRHKMRRGIHAKLVIAKNKGIPSSQVFKREALSRYTHLGKRPTFLKYAYKAADIMGSQEIRQQVKPHMTWFKRAWKKEIARVYKS